MKLWVATATHNFKWVKITINLFNLWPNVCKSRCFNTSDMKSTWQNINSVLNKTKVKKQFPDKFKLDAQLLTDKFEIANQFNTFFVNIGTKHTKNIATPPNKSYKDYLASPCETSFNFTLVTENDINIIISKLNSKMCSGKDAILNIVLKAIMPVILKYRYFFR